MRHSILVAEDDELLRKMLHGRLEEAGYQITTVIDGDRALEHLYHTSFDLVLTDLHMPGASGIELLRWINAHVQETEAIIITGYADLDSAVQCLRAGAFDYVEKPFQMKKLLNSIACAIERRQLRASASLLEASKLIFEVQDSNHLPELIVQSSMKILKADDASLMLLDSENRLYIAHSYGLSSRITETTRIELGKRVAGRVGSEKTPMLLTDRLESNPQFKDIESHGRVRSSIVYPLLAGKRLVGVLNFNRVSTQQAFREQDMELAGVLAADVVLALENARMTQQMVSSNRLAAVGQVAAAVAHEIANPLTFIQANLVYLKDHFEEMLAGKIVSAEQLRADSQEALDVLTESIEGTDRMKEIIGSMLHLSRTTVVDDQAFNLSKIVESARRMTGPRIGGLIAIADHLCSELTVYGSSGQISQVMINLLVNAVQALENSPQKDPRIILRTAQKDNWAVFEIEDNGPGISPLHQARIFEPFFSTKSPGEGTGLGLAICRDIIARHGGEIQVESRLGEGSTFRVRLPVYMPSPDRAASLSE